MDEANNSRFTMIIIVTFVSGMLYYSMNSKLITILCRQFVILANHGQLSGYNSILMTIT